MGVLLRPVRGVMLSAMGWIQLCGFLWGSALGVAVATAARQTASLLVPTRLWGPRWCRAAGAAACGGVGWWGASHQVTDAGLAAMVGLILLIWWSLVATTTDVVARRLPNALTLPGFAAIIGYGIVVDRVSAPLVGGALLAAVYTVAYLCAPGSLGAGDVKLALGVGAASAFGGGDVWLLAAGAAPAITAMVGVVVRCRSDADAAPVALPHGAAMCWATVLALTIRLA